MHCHAPGSAGCMCSRSFDDSNCLVLSQQQSSPRHISDLACKKINQNESQQKDWIITQVLGQYHVLPWWTLCNPGLCFKMCLCSEQLQECCPNWSYRTRAVCTCKSQPLMVGHWTNQGKLQTDTVISVAAQSIAAKPASALESFLSTCRWSGCPDHQTRLALQSVWFECWACSGSECQARLQLAEGAAELLPCLNYLQSLHISQMHVMQMES